MSVVITAIKAVATEGRASRVGVEATVVKVYEGCYAVSCNGDAKGHECSGRADVLIEPGDTWSTEEYAVALADAHIIEHETRKD